MRRLLVFLLLIAAAPAYAFDPCTDAAEYVPVNVRHEKGLLFKLERCDLPPNYIFGTYHSNRPDILALGQDVKALLPKLDRLLVEYIEPENSAAISQQAMFYPQDGVSSLSAAIGTDTFERLLKTLETRQPYPPNVLNRMRPWAAALLLQLPDMEGDAPVLDEALTDLANSLQKPVIGLETMQEQYDIFQTLPESDQIEMLMDSLDNIPEIDRISKELVDAYLAQNLTRIEELADDSFSASAHGLLRDTLMQRLLYDRNKTMGASALRQSKPGFTLIAVGALHLPGDTGLLKQFEEAGYFVTTIPVQDRLP